MSAKINGRKAAETIAHRIDFTSHGALSGRNYPQHTRAYNISGYGSQLPSEHYNALHEALLSGPVYVVFSYETPIAWFSEHDNTWHRPDVKYSMTTTHHQGRCPRDGQEG